MPTKTLTPRPQPKVKVESISSLKKKAWDLFSKIIRLSAADQDGMASCVTCERANHWKKVQAGHFIPGRHNSILFDKRGVHVQCYGCNVPMKGNPRKYDAFMRKKYGEEVIRELEALDRETKQFSAPELMEIISGFKEELKKLDING